jgi:hypothetical protein
LILLAMTLADILKNQKNYKNLLTKNQKLNYPLKKYSLSNFGNLDLAKTNFTNFSFSFSRITLFIHI